MNASALILVVEDNPVLLRSTLQAIEAAGYSVMAASSAKETFLLIKEKRPDLILLDVVLPDLDGVELCRQLKADPETSGVFVVLISGFQIHSDHHVAGLQAGADAYITRPIHHRELVARLQALVRLQQAQAELRAARQALEQRVMDRTSELTETNARLRAEIAERQQLEARLLHSQKLQAVGQLAAGLAHDFNNILTVITCNASLLLMNKQLPPDTVECACQISAATERASNLTRQLLAFTRQQFFQTRPVDLNVLIERMSHMLGRTLGDHILLGFDLKPALPAVRADPGMIEQAVLNLALNARDAMPKGGQLRIRTTVVDLDAALAARNPEARPGSFVCLSVADTGCGMDTATLHHIFEPFFTTKDIGKGSGLGLASVHGIAGQHQGWVEVDSAIGRGSTFTLWLPSLSETVAPAPAPSVTISEKSGTETILIVEDDPAIRALVQDVLAGHGYRVLTAASGPEALQLWRGQSDQVDLLLTDMLMPHGMNGRELAESMRQVKPRLKVILTSGYGADITRKGGIPPLDVCFLEKPFDPDLLSRTVRKCLDTQHPSV